MQRIINSLSLFVALSFLSVYAYAASNAKVLLMVLPGCKYCQEAESILRKQGIKYNTKLSRQGVVPRLYVNGQYMGTGIGAVEDWLQKRHTK